MAGEGEGVVMVALLSKDVKFSGLNLILNNFVPLSLVFFLTFISEKFFFLSCFSYNLVAL